MISTDPRETPTYRLPEAAHYLRLPVATLRSWTVGQYYAVRNGRRFFRPLIRIADPSKQLLSFFNLVEAHVLDAIRRHEIPLQKVRKALDYLNRNHPSKHPLADQNFETDGIDLFIRKSAALISISESGQHAIREAVEGYLRRVDWDKRGMAVRLYPFTRKRDLDEPRAVVIDPRVQFGRPVLVRTGIPTSVIAERYKAGESIQELAKDYGRPGTQIEEAIRIELQVEAA